MAHTTSNSANVIRQELYNAQLQMRLEDWLVGMRLFNDRTSELMDGDTLYIDQVGQRTTETYTEDTPINFEAVDTTRIQLQVTEYISDGFYMTDKMKRVSWKADQLFQANVAESLRAFERQIETDAFATCNKQVLGDPNTINGKAHRFKITSAANLLENFRAAKLHMDLARVPAEGRVAFIDPSVEFELNGLFDIVAPTSGDVFNMDMEGIVTKGLGNRLNFIANRS